MDATNFDLGIARRARWAVAAVFFVNGFIVGSWAPHIPLVLKRLEITESTLGLLILCFGIGAITAMPWSGWVMARFGEKSALRALALVQGFGLLLVVLSPSVLLTALAAGLFGAAIGCTDVVMNAATVTAERRLGRAVMSSMHGFWSLGGFAGAGLGGFVLEALGALPHAAAVAVAALAVGALAFPHFIDARPEPVAPAGGERRKGGLPRSPIIYLLGVVTLFAFVSEGVILDWAAVHLTRAFDADVATASLPYAFFAGAMAAMRFLGDRVRGRLGAVPFFRLSSLIGALAMLSAALAPSPWLVVAAFAVCGLGLANTVPIAFSAAGNQPGLSSGASMSVVTTMGYAGILLAPSSIGFVGERFGFAPVFAAMAGLLFIAFLLSPIVRAADLKPAGRGALSDRS